MLNRKISRLRIYTRGNLYFERASSRRSGELSIVSRDLTILDLHERFSIKFGETRVVDRE